MKEIHKKQVLISAFLGSIQTFIHRKHFMKKNKSRLFVDGKTCFLFADGSKIELNSHLYTGRNSLNYDASRTTLIRLEKNASLIISGTAEIFYGCDIVVFEGGTLRIGSSYINSDCIIRVDKDITIGDGCAISHGLTIMDSNFHSLNGDVGSSPVTIEDHVWIGANVTILPGVKISKGSMVAAGSVVTNSFPENTLIAGNPAHALKNNILWED